MIEIIPAIDIRGGKCVRLVQGDFARETVYSDDPAEVAMKFVAAGIRRLHMVDLDGAVSGRPVNLDILRRASAERASMIDFGGGVRSVGDVRSILEAGASFVTIGSLAIRSPEKLRAWIEEFGEERFLIGIDVRDGFAAVDGWTETTDLALEDATRRVERSGVTRVFVTDISKDGAMDGPSLDLYRRILANHPGLELIASGGVRDIKDVRALDAIGCKGVIVGRAIYEGAITLEELRAYVS